MHQPRKPALFLFQSPHLWLMTSCLAVRTIMCCTSRHERSRLDVNKPCYTNGNVESVYPLLVTLWEISLVKQPPIVTLYHLFRRVKKISYEHCLRREMTFRYWPGISFIARKMWKESAGKTMASAGTAKDLCNNLFETFKSNIKK